MPPGSDEQAKGSMRKMDPDPVAFFATAYQTFEQATYATGGWLERFYSIGGHTVRLRFAGPTLLPQMTRALEHLSTRPIPVPSLTICLWDDASTHTIMPPPPWLGYVAYNPQGDTRIVYTRRGDVRGFNNDRVYTAYNWGADVLNVLDKDLGLAVYWTRDARRLPSYETSAPLRTILHWWVNQHGYQFVHGGAVGTTDRGVLLAGKGGSGKSTTALACLNSCLVYLGDDYCLVKVDPAPYAYSVYSSAKLDADNIHRLPHLLPALSNAHHLDTEKAVFYLHPRFQDKMVCGFPICAILLPRISGRPETRLVPASPLDGLKALALSTMSQLARAGQTSIQLMHRLAHQVPCIHLELGTDLSRIPEVILRLLEKG